MATVTACAGLIYCQLARATIVLTSLISIWTCRLFAARSGICCNFIAQHARFRSAFLWCRRRSGSTHCSSFIVARLGGFQFNFGFGALFTFPKLKLFGFVFFAALIALSLASELLFDAARFIFSFAGLRGLNSLQTAIHFRIRNPSRATRRITTTHSTWRHGLSCTRFWHNDAFTFGFHQNILCSAMAETLFHISRTWSAQQTQCLFTVVAHKALSSFSEGQCPMPP